MILKLFYRIIHQAKKDSLKDAFMLHWRNKLSDFFLPKRKQLSSRPNVFATWTQQCMILYIDCGGWLSLSRLNVSMACWTNGRSACLLKIQPASTTPRSDFTSIHIHALDTGLGYTGLVGFTGLGFTGIPYITSFGYQTLDAFRSAIV